MGDLLTSAQMRAVEQAAIAAGGVTGLDLMERAGRGVVEAIFARWPDLAAAPRRAVVLCGPGNNGGDGFVVARLLRGWGWRVDVFLFGAPDNLPPDARANHDRWLTMGAVQTLDDLAEDSAAGAALFVDALFGTGLTRPLDRRLRGALTLLTQGSRALPRPPRKVAVDIESGRCADSGALLQTDPPEDWYPGYGPDLTVTFGFAKPGHLLAPACQPDEQALALAGALEVMPIGVEDTLGSLGIDPVLALAGGLPRYARRLDKAVIAHKYGHGHALVVSGGAGQGGAARLAARAALRAGAGLVTLAVPEPALPENAAQLTAVMLGRVDTPGDLTRRLQDGRLSALCLGPGMGVERAAALLPVALASGRPMVLDADALTALAQDPTLFARLHERCILTPHGGEFARLFPDLADRLSRPPSQGPAWSKIDATRAAAARAGCTVLFKGVDTVIASPLGACSLHAALRDHAAPWLATAGAGDVLAGVIAGLLARGWSPMEAAEAATCLHAEAGRHAGPGLIAEDLPEALAAVLRAALP